MNARDGEGLSPRGRESGGEGLSPRLVSLGSVPISTSWFVSLLT